MELKKREKEFLDIIQAHKGIIYKIANAYCTENADRPDLVQEIIMQVWRSFGNYDPSFKHSTWIYRIALNVSISYQRKSWKRSATKPLSHDLIILPVSYTENQTEEQLSLLQKFIAGLKELDKALMLLYLEEKSHREISEILGISESNVATKINRVKKILRDKFITQNK